MSKYTAQVLLRLEEDEKKMMDTLINLLKPQFGRLTKVGLMRMLIRQKYNASMNK